MTFTEVVSEVLLVALVSLVFVLYRASWVIQLKVEKEEAKYWRDRWEESERFTADLTKAILCRPEVKETSVRSPSSTLPSSTFRTESPRYSLTVQFSSIRCV